MAQIVYTGIKDYDARSAAGMNTILGKFETQSTNIDASNFRDEGLDERVLDENVVTDDYDITSYEAQPETFANTLAAKITFTSYPGTKNGVATSPCPIEIDNGGDGWTLRENETLRIRFGTEFRIAMPKGVGYPDRETPELTFELFYTNSVGTETPITGTYSMFVGSAYIWPIGPSPGTEVNFYNDSVEITWLLKGTEAGRVIQAVSAWAFIDSGDYQLRCTSIQATAFYR